MYYFIKSYLNGMVLDADNSNATPGTLVFPFPKHGGPNQQWRVDPSTGTIRSKLNEHLCLDIEGGRLVLNPYQPGKQDQQWERKYCAIANRCDGNMVLDIFNSDKNAGAKVIKFKALGRPNQSWTFEPVGGC